MANSKIRIGLIVPSTNTTQVYLSVTANHLEEAIGLLDE